MIYLIFGASCSGKSTFIKNTWFTNSIVKKEHYDFCPYTETDNAILIGRYLVGIGAHGRTVGGDRVSRTFGKNLRDFILLCRDKFGEKDIVVDGFKALTRESIRSIIDLGIPITMLYITCSTEVSIKRNIDNNTTVKLSTLKSCQTKAKNYYEDFSNYVYKSIYVITDRMTFDDMRGFSLYSIDKYKSVTPNNKLLF